MSVAGGVASRDRGFGLGGVVVVVVAVGAAGLGMGVRATPGEWVAVDEPQYLMTAQSIARDGDLDIANQVAGQSWREFTGAEPPVETVVRPDGGQISPHDPLLPILLAGPMALGGWVGAKIALALLAGLLAFWTLWLAVRRFAIPLLLATIGVAVAGASAPLAVYGQQIYPELPAAVAVVAGLTALTARPRRRTLLLLAVGITALPWLSIKYAPIAIALAGAGLIRWWRTATDTSGSLESGSRQPGGITRRRLVGFVGGLAVMALVYVIVHVQVWGGMTVYASGDHFTETGQLGVMGNDPQYLFRSWRLMDLLVDSRYGLVSWQPAWLLLVPALAVLRRDSWVLVAPLAAGWLVATYAALTMHGYWWPGRQLVAVLPLAVILVLRWLTTPLRKATALVLGAAGVFTYIGVLLDGYQGELTWVRGFFGVDAPIHQALVPLLADYGDARTNPVTISNLVWLGLLTALAISAYVVDRKRQAGKNETVPSTARPTASSTTSR